jgi:YggT family protein
MRSLLCQLVLLFEVALFGRVILSWFPLQGGGVMAKINRFLVRVTDPVLEPVRRVLPRMGMFDLSPIIVFLVLEIVVRGLILQCYTA